MLTNRRSRYYRNLIERSNRKNSILSKANRTLESKNLDIIESESNARIEKTRYESNANRNRKRCVLTAFNSLSSRILKYRKRKRKAKVKRCSESLDCCSTRTRKARIVVASHIWLESNETRSESNENRTPNRNKLDIIETRIETSILPTRFFSATPDKTGRPRRSS